MGSEIVVVGLHAVVGWVEWRVGWEWEARVCHCDQTKNDHQHFASGFGR